MFHQNVRDSAHWRLQRLFPLQQGYFLFPTGALGAPGTQVLPLCGPLLRGTCRATAEAEAGRESDGRVANSSCQFGVSHHIQALTFCFLS